MTTALHLDYNARTPIAPQVREAMLPFLAEHYGNPSSEHWAGTDGAKSVCEQPGAGPISIPGRMTTVIASDHEMPPAASASSSASSAPLFMVCQYLPESPGLCSHVVSCAYY